MMWSTTKLMDLDFIGDDAVNNKIMDLDIIGDYVVYKNKGKTFYGRD